MRLKRLNSSSTTVYLSLHSKLLKSRKIFTRLSSSNTKIKLTKSKDTITVIFQSLMKMLQKRPANRLRKTIPCIVMRMACAKRERLSKMKIKMMTHGLTFSVACKPAIVVTLGIKTSHGSCGFLSALPLAVFAHAL